MCFCYALCVSKHKHTVSHIHKRHIFFSEKSCSTLLIKSLRNCFFSFTNKQIKRNTLCAQQVFLNFSTANMKSLPIEIYDNEELSALVVQFNAENNRLKKLPKSLANLENLEYITVRNNTMNSFPASVSRMKKLVTLDVTNNAIKKLPPAIHKASALTTLLAPNNRLRTLPKNIGKSTSLAFVDVSGNLIKSFKKVFSCICCGLFCYSN